jgi:hypothetical protein
LDTRALAVCSEMPSVWATSGVGPLVDDSQAQYVALVVRPLAKGGGDALAQLREPGQLDDAFAVVLADRREPDAESVDGLALDHAGARTATQLMARDAVQPAAGFGIGQPPEAPPMLERLCERIRGEVARNLDVKRSARKERQQLREFAA